MTEKKTPTAEETAAAKASLASTLAATEPAKALEAPAPAAPKLVKIKVLMPIALAADQMYSPGDVVEVTEAHAKEYADRVFKGHYDFGGERSDATATHHHFRRAQRVA